MGQTPPKMKPAAPLSECRARSTCNSLLLQCSRRELLQRLGGDTEVLHLGAKCERVTRSSNVWDVQTKVLSLDDLSQALPGLDEDCLAISFHQLQNDTEYELTLTASFANKASSNSTSTELFTVRECTKRHPFDFPIDLNMNGWGKAKTTSKSVPSRERRTIDTLGSDRLLAFVQQAGMSYRSYVGPEHLMYRKVEKELLMKLNQGSEVQDPHLLTRSYFSACGRGGTASDSSPGSGYLSSWVFDVPGKFIWIFDLSFDTVLELFMLACFTLPTFRPWPMCAVINPEERYCIDLLPSSGAPPDCWARSKMVRRHAKDLRVTVNLQFRKSVEALKRYHEGGRTRSTWLTEKLIDVLEDMHEQSDKVPVKQMVFEFWEKRSDVQSEATSEADSWELVALTAGFGVRLAFHDYSMATLKRDKRSLGNIATKCVGDILQKCGYQLWYWGVKLGYMGEFDEKGGRKFGREEFAQRWTSAAAAQPFDVDPAAGHHSAGYRVFGKAADAKLDVVGALKAGQGLVKWREDAI
eukprot:TRINITY_DN32906_c0_g1_i1.p1 TRINITY_DN32906_c0_g1~~TRINITY_DN32906_c0_g1_i1.p1  ORF type:complete len:524 (+),score=80.62 TRINITY_DN32906_c0_g1_i1:48-1619(+)